MKKTINKYIHLAVCSVLLLTVSCKKLLDVNEDPNNPAIESATSEVLFPAGVMSTAGMVGGHLAILGGMWSQFWTQSNNSSQYREIDSYNLTSTNEEVNLPYQELYAGALKDYRLAKDLAIKNEDWRYNLMVTVMNAYTYQVLVDLYDRVPYSEALMGKENLQPKFDDGYSIYVSLLADINDALSKDFRSKAFGSSQIRSDIVFGDKGGADFEEEMDNWVKFANTLKLKMYLRMVNVRPSEAQAGITSLYNSGAQFLDIDAGVDIFENVPNKSNPFYEFNIRRLNTTTNIRASRTLTSFLLKNDDIRDSIYFGKREPSAINQGDYTATNSAMPSYGSSATFSQSATDPVWFITEAESYFMQAEALERYYGGAGAKAKYNAGVIAAFEQIGLTSEKALDYIDPLRSTFVSQSTYVYSEAASLESKIEKIITQKWLSLPGSHALEAFFEQNRTGYPKISSVYSSASDYEPGELVYAKNGITGPGNFPRRLVFPDYERTRNVNTPTEVPIYTKVWWAK